MLRIIILVGLLILFGGAAQALSVEILSTSPAPPVAGEYVDITIRVQAASNEQVRRNLTVSILDSPLLLPVSAPRHYGQLGPGEQLTATFRAYISEVAPRGNIVVRSQVSGGGGSTVTEHELYIENARRAPQLVVGQMSTVPDMLLPDTHQNRLVIVLQNLGELDAELVTAELRPLDNSLRASSAFSLRNSVASIPGGEQRALNYTIDIRQNPPETIDAELRLRYRVRLDGTGSYDTVERVIRLEIPIDESPFLQVVSQEVRSSFRAGSSENVLRVTIANTGVEEARDVRVRLFPDVSVPFIFERTTQYIGARVPPGGNASFDIIVEVTSQARPHDYEIALELESLVQGTRFSQRDTVTLPVAEGSRWSTRQVALGVIAVVILLSLGVAYVLRREKRK
jgi:hypothetical protein